MVVFDVDNLSDAEIAALRFEVGVQGEASDDHGHAPVTGHFIVEGPSFVIPLATAMSVAAESLGDEFASKAPSCKDLAGDFARNAMQAIILSGTEIE